MKPTRTTALILLLCLLLSCFAGCSGQARDEFPKTVVDGDSRYEISLVDPLPADQIEPMMASLVPAAYIDFNSCVGIIAKGSISNLQEIRIDFHSDAANAARKDSDPPVTTPFGGTLFDFTIEENYYTSPDVGEVPQTIRVFYGYGSHFMPDSSSFPDRYILDEGKDYYLFIQTKENRIAEFQQMKRLYPEFAEAHIGQEMPLECSAADYSVFAPAHMLFNESSPGDMIKYSILDAFGSGFNSNSATEAYISAGDYSIAAYEQFLREYGRVLSENPPAYEDDPESISETTLVPEPDDASNKQDEETTPEPDDASARQGG